MTSKSVEQRIRWVFFCRVYWIGINILAIALEPCWCPVKNPCHCDSDWKTDNQSNNNNGNRPIRKSKGWQNDIGNLHQNPSGCCVESRDSKDLASFQLTEEITHVRFSSGRVQLPHAFLFAENLSTSL